MRRFLPWLATALVGAGATAAATLGSLGVPGEAPSTWASGVVAATTASGTAHVRIVIATRPSGTVGRLAGTVDLSADAYRLTTKTTGGGAATTLVEIGIGDRSYVHQSQAGAVSTWVETVGTGIERDFGASQRVFGALRHPAAIWQVQDLGPSPIGGGTTHYRVTVRTPTPSCRPTTFQLPSLQVWLDPHDRLVRSQLAVHFATRRAPGAPITWQTSIETVELRDFGAPLTISPPPAHEVRSGAYSSTLRSHCAA